MAVHWSDACYYHRAFKCSGSLLHSPETLGPFVSAAAPCAPPKPASPEPAEAPPSTRSSQQKRLEGTLGPILVSLVRKDDLANQVRSARRV